MDWTKVLQKLDGQRWALPKEYKSGMRVPGIVFADDKLLSQIKDDPCLEQVANVAFLPGIVGHSLAMPDIHWGYGFPIGGVAATRVDRDGVVSPGGVGFDINCGVRLLRTDLRESEIRPRMRELVAALFRDIPTGVGSSGRIKLSARDINRVLTEGARWAIEHGLGDPDDLEVTEEGGRMDGANPNSVGERPKARGGNQLGTLGSGNHFLEVQAVDEIFDPHAASAMGLTEVGQVTVMIHTGSRGLGHQVCTDFLRVIEAASRRYGMQLPDWKLLPFLVPSLILTLFLSAAIQTFLYMAGFWTVSTRGSASLAYAVISLFSGLLVPLAFFPPVLRQIAEILPFSGIYDTPALLYSGAMEASKASLRLCHQVLWLAGLTSLGFIMARRGIRKLEVAGG